MAMLDSGPEDCILPVGTLTQHHRIAVVGVGLSLTLLYQVVVERTKLTQVHHVKTLGLAVHGHHTVVRELSLTGLTVLGGNQDNTVSTLRTIDGGCRGVLQDFHRNDVGGIDGRQRGDGRNRTVTQSVAQTEVGTRRTTALNNHTVDDVERFSVGVDCCGTTHAD